MALKENDFIHKGLKAFWVSAGEDKSGINTTFAKVIRGLLVHLDTAKNMDDLKEGLGRVKNLKSLTGHQDRFELEVNGNWRITFDCVLTNTAININKIDLEDVHRKGGAKKH